MVGIAGSELLHQLFPWSYPLAITDLFSHSPTAIPDVAGACVVLGLVLYLKGDLALMGMMLQGGDESKGIEEGSPIFESSRDDLSIVGVLMGVCA